MRQISSFSQFGIDLLSLVLILCLYSCSEKINKPNIIFIMSDDHAAQAIGVYGSHLASLNPTTVLDELASSGITFANCFVTNSICTPSRACIITGQYSHVNGILDLEDREDPSRHDIPGMAKKYLPIEMRKPGYETAMIGKWHLITEPNFDYYEVLPGQGRYFNPDFIKRGNKPWPENRTKYEGHSTDLITDLSIEWIRNRKSDKPFFLMYLEHLDVPAHFGIRTRDYKLILLQGLKMILKISGRNLGIRMILFRN